MVKSNLNTVDAINSDKDVALYQKEYQNQNFITPSRILYCNFYNGVYKGNEYIYIRNRMKINNNNKNNS